MPTAKETVSWLMPLLFVALATLGGWAIAHELRMPGLPPASPPIRSASEPESGTPFAVVYPDHMTLTLVTQVPTPKPAPPPTYALSTVPPDVLCGSWIREGQTCLMPILPAKPTVLPDCPVRPNDECIWHGTLYATPLAEAQ